MSKLFIGTSGYAYNHWIEVFYPKDLSKSKWLEFYTQYFNTVELNVTFYRLPQKKAFVGWYQRTPENFRFGVKGSRFITHIKKLKGSEDSLKIFFDQVSALREKLGVVLWQLAPNHQLNIDRLEEFCRDLKQASYGRIRHAFEFRHRSWFCQPVYQILRKYHYALVCADYPFQLKIENQMSSITNQKAEEDQEKLIKIPPTADFVYLRRHGATSLYSSNYSDTQLKREAVQIKEWSGLGKDVYVYFNNDAMGYAVKNALTLKKMIS